MSRRVEHHPPAIIELDFRHGGATCQSMLHGFLHILDMEVQMRHLLLFFPFRRPNGRHIIVRLLNGNPGWKALLLQVRQDCIFFTFEPRPAEQPFIKCRQLVCMIGIQDNIPSHKIKRQNIPTFCRARLFCQRRASLFTAPSVRTPQWPGKAAATAGRG